MGSKLNGNVKGQGTTAFSQSVNFFHEVNVRGLGQVKVNGKIPYFRPEYSRTITGSISKDVEKLIMESVDWARQVMQIEEEECTLKKMGQCCTMFAVFCNPQLEIFSRKMQQIIRLLVCIYIFDEFVDVTSSSSDITYEDMHEATIILRDLWNGKYDKDFNIQEENTSLSNQIGKFESIPIFRQLFTGFLDIRKQCLKIFPDLDQRSQGIIRGLEQYLNSVEWSCLTPLDKTYSLEMYKQFRSAVVAAELAFEFFGLHQGIVIPMQIRSHLIFQRYLTLLCDIHGFTNDVLGLTKDLNSYDSGNGDTDSTIMFQILEKNIEPEIAIAQAVQDLNERLEDLMQLKFALLTAFPGQPDVVAYIKLAESTIDGHFRVCSHISRYSMDKNVFITDNEELSE